MLDIFSYQNGKVTKLKALPVSNKGLLWVDVTSITKEEQTILKDRFGLHPLTAEDLLNQGIRVKVEEFPGYLFTVFYGPGSGNTFNPVEMDMVLGKRFLITNHKVTLETFTALKNDVKGMARLFKKGLDFLFHHLIDKEVDEFFPVLENLDDKVEELETKIVKKPNPKLLTEIQAVKRSIVKVKRITLAQREKIGFLAKRDYPEISKEVLPYIRDVYDHSIRVSDSIDNSREAIGNAFDVYMSALSNNMNEVMKTLSIIATIALPLTVISGIYGTNFSILPGSQWNIGFWAMIAAMVVLSVVMLSYFRRRGWF